MKQNAQQIVPQITGTYKCPVCGGSTTVKNETNPVPLCHYCGAPLPELKQKLDEQFAFIQEQFRLANDREELKLQYAQQQKIIRKETAAKIHTAKIESNRQIKETKIREQAQTEQLRLKAIQERNRQRHEENKRESVILLIMIVIVFIIFLTMTKN